MRFVRKFRVKPFKTFGQDGLGALELALRYDHLDLSNGPTRPGNKGEQLDALAQLVS